MKKLDFDENKILDFWQKNKTFEISLEKRKGKKRFVFYEGPPFANARPGIHHVLARSFKDLIARYKTMKGFYVPRKAGFDTHGLPTEMAVEKQLNIKAKKDIEKMGIEKFTELCQKSIFTYKKEWEELTKRMGYWLDLKNAYITCENGYIESVWWVLKQIWDKGLLYEDEKVMPYCPRCGTSLSDHEVALGYRKTKDPSIYVKFILKSKIINHKSYFLVWTTTPWTLPANTALAINPKAKYVQIKTDKENLILAKERLSVIKEKFKVVNEFTGEKLLSAKYEPLYNLNGDYKIVSADFVNMKEGTGIVHIAPAFGSDDLNLAKKEKLKVIMTVDREGKINEKLPQYQGIFVKNADNKIIDDLKKKKILYKSEIIMHNYPFCWRCETPLLYYAKKSWYIKTKTVVSKMLDENNKINWVPEYIKNGRFGNWLKENNDWAISRERFWGTPLPFWRCQIGKSEIRNPKSLAEPDLASRDKTNSKFQISNSKHSCGYTKIIGSLKELKRFSIKPLDIQNLDLHRPQIDKIFLRCEKCGGKMERVKEVLDCWFDSGSMPYAQLHYPFENQKEFEKNYPADFIAEGIDQTRGWFYTLLAISTLLEKPAAYKNVVSLGLVLDENGQKMSKSRGNTIDPLSVMERFGADAVRLYFYLAPLGETVRFSEKELQEVYRKFILTFINCLTFYKTYSEIKKENKDNLEILDKWILSRTYEIAREIEKCLEKYDVSRGARLLYYFVQDDLSNWYIRRSRKRNSLEFYQTLKKVLLICAKISAPFTPFIAEYVYSQLSKDKESVHIKDWPKIEERKIDKNLNQKMLLVRQVCEKGLALRAENKIKVRQPLPELRIKNYGLRMDKDLLNLISGELNVHKINLVKSITKQENWVLKKEGKIEIVLDTTITKELVFQGILREIIHQIQSIRKQANLSPGKIVSIKWNTSDKDLLDVMSKNKETIEKETNVKLHFIKDIFGQEFSISRKKIQLALGK